MSVELLSPAGSRQAMGYAFSYGADAVSAGQPRYSLHVRNIEFDKPEHLAETIQRAHSQGKTFYLASNLAPHNDKIRSFVRALMWVVKAKFFYTKRVNRCFDYSLYSLA